MNKKGKLILGMVLCAVLMGNPVKSFAEEFRHHVVVLLDRSSPMDKTQNRVKALKEALTSDLEELCFNEGLIVEGRKLLDASRGDYLSVLSFGMEKKEPDFHELIQEIKSENNENYTYWQKYREGGFASGELWSAINNKNNYPDFFSYNWSAISLSMPMGIYYLGQIGFEKNIKVNRTFVVHITDEAYNAGADSILEIDHIKRITRDEGQMVKNSEDVARIHQAVQSTMLWRKVPEGKPYGKKYKKVPIKVKLYEFSPIAKVFAIESQLQYDVRQVEFKRVNGGYRSDFRIAPINMDSPFKVLKLEARLENESGDVVGGNSVVFENLDIAENVVFRLPHGTYGAWGDLTMRVRFWVHWKNEVYGVHVLHPDGGSLQGAEGLNRLIGAKFEESQDIWGAIPMSDSFFDFSSELLGGDQVSIQKFWEKFLAIIAILITGGGFVAIGLLAVVRLKKGLVVRSVDDIKPTNVNEKIKPLIS